MARFRSYDRDVVRLAVNRPGKASGAVVTQAATYYAVNGFVDIPDSACEVYAESIAEKVKAGKLARVAIVVPPSQR
jgi:hypothetical protein